MKDYRESLAAQAKTYLDANKAATALSAITVYRGLSTTELKHPAIIVHCPEARPYSPGLGIWRVNLEATILSSLTEGLSDTGVTHRSRFAALTALFDDESPTTVTTGLTSAGVITTYGFEIEEMTGLKEDQVLADTLRLAVFVG